MSSKAITAATTHFLQFRLQYSSLALLYYDYALTFPKEVQYIWNERFRVSTALYIGCRYALVANVLYLLAIADKLGSTIVGALSVLGRAAVIAVFTMRTYAVYGMNKWVLAYMSVVGLACVALDIMLSILMVIFESSAAFLTTARCVVAFRAGGGLQIHRHGISTTSIFTTAAVILNYPGFFQRLPNAFTLPFVAALSHYHLRSQFFSLSCILTARFILHLREWEAEKVGGNAESQHSKPLSAVRFQATATRSAVSSLLSLGDFGEDPVALARLSSRAKGTELRLPNSSGGSTGLDGADEDDEQVGTSQSSARMRSSEDVV
ncbi:hypothetical protein B0H16DRAFT_1660514 [Mycena metata]|uniref:DUF6533 domain-containing protein n=1 Tax=Mycena metata TaxID=1033252 RepID=A0AAD7NRL4_9AGAR|nr:hypothetical protein B0H16DRAFT_1660514 [Mycena metata]